MSGIGRLNAQEFYKLSGGDFQVDRDWGTSWEEENYKKVIKADGNKNGIVTYDEYLKYLKKVQPKIEISNNSIKIAKLLSKSERSLIRDPWSDPEENIKIRCKMDHIAGVTFYDTGEVEDIFIKDHGKQEGITSIAGIKYLTSLNRNNDDVYSKYGTFDYYKSYLVEEIEIGEYPCSSTDYYLSLKFHKNGKAKEGVLAEDTKLQGIEIPKDSKVFYNEEGKLEKVFLSKSIVINGYKCFGEDRFGEDEAILFHTNGRLKEASVLLKTSGDFNKKWGSARTMLSFLENGEIDMSQLDKDFENVCIHEVRSMIAICMESGINDIVGKTSRLKWDHENLLIEYRKEKELSKEKGLEYIAKFSCLRSILLRWQRWLIK